MRNIKHPKFPGRICTKNVPDKDKALFGVTLWTQSLMLYLMLRFLDTLNLVQSMGENLN